MMIDRWESSKNTSEHHKTKHNKTAKNKKYTAIVEQKRNEQKSRNVLFALALYSQEAQHTLRTKSYRGCLMP